MPPQSTRAAHRRNTRNGAIWYPGQRRDRWNRIDQCYVTGYSLGVIRSFRHKGLAGFFETGSRKGIRPEHAQRLRDILFRLDNAGRPDDMDFPGSRLHPLKGDRAGTWSVTVSGNWRVLFRFRQGHAWDVDYEDYH